MTWEENQYLIHYGVKGQKHGIRRYQNEDGSLTAEGKDHYGIGDGRGPQAGILSRQKQKHSPGTISEDRPSISKPRYSAKNTAQAARNQVDAIKNLVKKKKADATNADSEKDKKKQMREHRAKWLANMMGVGASMLSQKLVSSAAKKNPKLKSFYKGMTAVNVASIIANSASAYHEGHEYQKIKHPERYKKG